MKLTNLIKRYLCDGTDEVHPPFASLDTHIPRSTSCSSFISRIFARPKSVQPMKQQLNTTEYNVNQKCSCVICSNRDNFMLSENFSASQVECKRNYSALNEDVRSYGSSTTLSDLSFTQKLANCDHPSELREFPTSFSDPFGAVVFNPNDEFTTQQLLKKRTTHANYLHDGGRNFSKDASSRYMNGTAITDSNPWFSYPGSQSEHWRHSSKIQTKDPNQFVYKSMTDSGIFVNSDSSVPEKQQPMPNEGYTPKFRRSISPTVSDSSYIQLNADPPPSPAPQSCMLRLADIADIHMGYIPS
ncbi:hypothetical protein PHET_01790 [Paragonimus heterotremus]|uniref:Uncharacterized protein n=1 Tax=Paragonimus heterotremus TaxID=100268 RepID=A0A8J4T525_9TREM|nr:hypothetical protein PHET_01790 [Paragonimus heterotremus]